MKGTVFHNKNQAQWSKNPGKLNTFQVECIDPEDEDVLSASFVYTPQNML